VSFAVVEPSTWSFRAAFGSGYTLYRTQKNARLRDNRYGDAFDASGANATSLSEGGSASNPYIKTSPLSLEVSSFFT
jgi:hypothetical protein